MSKTRSIAQRTQKVLSNSSEVVDLRKKNQELQKEIAKFEQDGSLRLDRSQIRPSKQVRKTITKEAVSKRANSLLENGQANPLILVPLSNDPDYSWELEDGELTWRASGLLVQEGHLEWQFLDGKKSTQSLEHDAHKRSFLHHRHKEGLNALDDTEALLYEVSKVIDWSLVEIVEKSETEEEINQLIKKAICKLAEKWREPTFVSFYQELLEVSQEKRQEKIRSLELDYLTQTVLLQFQLWDEPNPNAFYANKLPLVFLSAELKKAIRDSSNPIGCSHALAISRVDKRYHQDLIEQCRANNWSLKELRAVIKESTITSSIPKKKKKQKISFREQKSFLNKITQSSIDQVKLEQAKTLAVKYQELAQLYQARVDSFN